MLIQCSGINAGGVELIIRPFSSRVQKYSTNYQGVNTQVFSSGAALLNWSL